MKTNTIKATAESAEGTLFLGDEWFDPLEAGVRTRIRGFIEELLEAELDAARIQMFPIGFEIGQHLRRVHAGISTVGFQECPR